MFRKKYKIVHGKDSTAELSSVELAASVKGRLRAVATLGKQLRTAATSVFKTLWLGWEEPSTVSQLAQWMALVPNRVEVWKESAARAGVEHALSFALSWYKGIDLDQLEHLRKDGLNDIDPAKLRQCVCAIVECADTATLFDTGEGEGDKDMELEVSSFTGSPEKMPEVTADDSAPPTPDGDGFVLAVRTAEGPLSEPADAPADS
jgi:hypothetical protein